MLNDSVNGRSDKIRC